MEPLGMRRMGEHNIAAKDPMLLTEAEAYELYAPDTAFVLDVTDDTLTSAAVYASKIRSNVAADSSWIDWGDGQRILYTSGGIKKHTYEKSGRYVVRVSDSFSSFGVGAVSAATRAKMVVLALRLGDNLTSLEGNMAYPGFARCVNLKNKWLPRWPQNCTTLRNIYVQCSGITASSLPEWPKSVINANSTYKGCTGLTGAPADWSGCTSLTSANYTYQGCTGLTGAPADWSGCTSLVIASYTYQGCTGLTGDIPAWGEKITSANYTYQGCTGLTGDIPAWGEKITSANRTYSNCAGLKGDIPSWGAKITTAEETYYRCTHLTGAWTDDPAELMPTNITSHDFCVSGTSDAVRKLFYSDWGGYREKTETTTT